MSACGTTPDPIVITEFETVKVKVPQFVPLPEDLTDDCAIPSFPDRYTVKTSMDYIGELQSALKECNKDKQSIRERQPQDVFDLFSYD